jgi:hypothetical protein
MFGDNVHGGTPESLIPPTEFERGTDRGIDGLLFVVGGGVVEVAGAVAAV